MFSLILWSALASAHFAHAESQDSNLTQLPPAQFVAESSFETLNQTSFVPVQKASLSSDRSQLLDELKYQTAYPAPNLGYPSSPSVPSLGGRSTEDTQVTSLGVPLNLAQGGGADFSFFPSFLWQSAIFSPTPGYSGFTPSAASGQIELLPWTREALFKRTSRGSRVTLNYDRDLQTFSAASSGSNWAALAGGSTGRQQGPAGSLSLQAWREKDSQLLIHFLAASENGDSPGSKTYPSPRAEKETWRLIPVLEYHRTFRFDFALETTAFADLQKLKFKDPDQAFNNSETHTQVYGIENALRLQDWTLAFSARFVSFESASFSTIREWPLFLNLSRDFYFGDQLSLKLSANATSQTRTGTEAGGKASLRFGSSDLHYPFLEYFTAPKMPSLSARFYQFEGYRGNPGLRPERVHALLFGYQLSEKDWLSTTSIKLETRNQIQVFDVDTTRNFGHASLASFNQNFEWSLCSWFKLHSLTLLSISQLESSKFSYPDLAFLNQAAGFLISPGSQWRLRGDVKYQGPSIQANGAFHAPFTLTALSTTYQFKEGLQAGIGIDNLLDSRAEAVVDYPLPGRIVYASLQAQL